MIIRTEGPSQSMYATIHALPFVTSRPQQGTAWFRLRRDYEDFNDHSHAKDCFEQGVKLNVESWLRASISLIIIYSFSDLSVCPPANGHGPPPQPTLPPPEPNPRSPTPPSHSNPRIPNLSSTSIRLRPPLRIHRTARCTLHTPPRISKHESIPRRLPPFPSSLV